MPYGLYNDPATFSSSVSLVLRGLSWKSVIAFLYDVAVLGRDFDSHMMNLSDLLRRFEQYGIKLSKKCQFLQNSLVFRLVSREGMQVPPGRLLELISVVYHCANEMFSLLFGPKFPLVSYSKVCIGGKALFIILWDRRQLSDGVQTKRRHLMN